MFFIPPSPPLFSFFFRCGSISMMQWEHSILIRGRPPAKRYGHSMLTLSPPSAANCGYAKLAVFGGTSGAIVLTQMQEDMEIKYPPVKRTIRVTKCSQLLAALGSFRG